MKFKVKIKHSVIEVKYADVEVEAENEEELYRMKSQIFMCAEDNDNWSEADQMNSELEIEEVNSIE